MVLAGTTTSSPEAGVTCRSSAPKKICWASVEGFGGHISYEGLPPRFRSLAVAWEEAHRETNV